MTSTWWSLPTGNWTFPNNLEIYGTKYKIQDCRSGVCYDGWLYYNGYISPNRINSYDSSGKPNGVMGVPANYKPAGAPLIPWGSTALPPNAPANTNVSQFWDTNTVWVPLNNGTVQRTTYNDNNHPWRKDGFTSQLIPGVSQWGQDASLFKFMKLTEGVTLRFNVDFFNVFNVPGNILPNAMGIIETRNSQNAARVMQLSARFAW